MSDRMAGILEEIGKYLQREEPINPEMMPRSYMPESNVMSLAPYMAKGLINDVARYGKQAFTGEVSDREVLPQQPLTGDAKAVADAFGSGVGKALNYQVPTLQGSRSVMDDINMVVDAYQGARPGIVDALGEPSVNRVEGAGLLGSMVIPGRAGKIKAYHGSPHDFDKFSTENIGTGEGAQAYGHGLYFADREGTAKSYKNELSASVDYDGKPILRRNKQVGTTGDVDLDDSLIAELGDVDKSIKFWENDLQSDSDALRDYAIIQIEKLKNAKSKVKTTGGGHMYEVDIDASADELLDYDTPLNTQSPKIQKAIDDMMNSKGVESYVRDFGDGAEKIYIGTGLGGKNTGREILKTISGQMGPASASQMLNDIGIKGIKYADAQTRFSPKGRTNNYVIFDDKTIEIARKYGVSIPVAGAILAGTMTPEEAQASEQQNRRGLLSNLQ